jgi:hypothetical protein
METIPPHLADLFSSEKRIKIFEAVSRMESSFTSKQIIQELKNERLPASQVLTCLQALRYRGYLRDATEPNVRKSGRGRPEIKGSV